MFYKACEYCPIVGAVREKRLPFGNADGTIVVVVPGWVTLTEEQRNDLELLCPEAYFVFFAACANVEDIDAAEVVCSVLLRNETRHYRKLLLYSSQTLRGLFNIKSEIAEREDGVKFSTYMDIGSADFKSQYKRLKNDES